MTIEQKALEIAIFDGWRMTTNTEAQKYSKHGEVSLPEDMLISRYMKFTTLQSVLSKEFTKTQGNDANDEDVIATLRYVSEFFLIPATNGVIYVLVLLVYDLISRNLKTDTPLKGQPITYKIGELKKGNYNSGSWGLENL